MATGPSTHSEASVSHSKKATVSTNSNDMSTSAQVSTSTAALPTPAAPQDDKFFATLGMSGDRPDPEPLIQNIWNYIYNFIDQPPPQYTAKPMLQVLREGHRILRSEPPVIDITGTVCIIGGVHGHGDSLVTLLSHCGMPPATTYVFLGCFSGQGFAPHESLFMLIAMKVRFPKHVFLLKGCFEDAEVLKGQDFIAGLHRRGLMEDALVWAYLDQLLVALPLAAVLNDNYLLVAGGIGPELVKQGIKELRKVERPPRLASHVLMTIECQWGCLKPPASGPHSAEEENFNDGSPTFTCEMVSQFCKDNKLRMVIRSRQIVNEGILNFPDQLLTVWSPVSFLDSFRNGSVALKLNGDTGKASITRYKTHDEDPKSLDDTKPPAGRNAMVL
uniref:SER_THR_PHOSPHATASE domain-containing protein n=1 Tax=Panagrellus redivivus TaxID=6233 RepID=A0A7E4ZY90_PANRE